MEITQADLRIGDYGSESISESFKDEKFEIQVPDINESDVCFTLDVKPSTATVSCSLEKNSSYAIISSDVEPNLNSIQQLPADSQDATHESLYPDSLDSESLDEEIARRMNQAAEAFVKSEDRLEDTYNISAVVIPSDILDELSLSIKKEKSRFESKWLRRESKDLGETSIICKVEDSRSDDSEEESPKDPLGVEGRSRRIARKRRSRRGDSSRHENRERLRKKAECMREKRKKLYEEESEAQRLERLAKEAAKRRELRMYYETPEQRRKRLDTEAARKREYRMYNESPDDKRKRLDREAERRRVKRLKMYANETPEERRARLNKESAKRREARLNQYAKETEEQQQERLRKDALRAREMRFTRSAIESEEERRQRLVKDALRKRELRMHGGSNVSHFTELQTVRNFEELNNVQMKDDPDNQLGGHYVSNWMMWFQNTLTQPSNNGDKTANENHQQSHA